MPAWFSNFSKRQTHEQGPPAVFEPGGLVLHERCFPHRIASGIWMWSDFSSGARDRDNIYHNGYLLEVGTQEALLVDPVCAGPEVLDAFASLPRPILIVLTHRGHVRDSLSFRSRFHLPVLALSGPTPEPLPIIQPDGTLLDGDQLPGDWQVLALPNQRADDELALYHAQKQVLLVGDALEGVPMQRLTVPGRPEQSAHRRALSGLQRLRGYSVSGGVLVSRGDPVLWNADALLADAIRLPHDHDDEEEDGGTAMPGSRRPLSSG